MDRREPEPLNIIVRKHWWKILLAAFTLGGIWTSLQAQLSMHTDSIRQLKEDSRSCHDFIITQNEINKKIESIDRKLDRLLRRP